MNILSNLYVILFLRIAHITGGVIWVGSAIVYLFLLVPAVRSSQPAGQKFMQSFGPRFAKMMPVVATITVVSGALLYSRLFVSGIDWIWTTGAGICLTIGAAAALASYVMGVAVFGPMHGKIGALDATMTSAGGPPKPEQVMEMNRLQSLLMKAYQFDFVLLAVALLAMAVARYL